MGADINQMVTRLTRNLSDKYKKNLMFYLAFLAKTKGVDYADNIKFHILYFSYEAKEGNPIFYKINPSLLHLLRMLTLTEIIKEEESENLMRMLESSDDDNKYLALKLIQNKYKKYDKFVKTPEGEQILYNILHNYYVDVVKFVNDIILKTFKK